MANVLLGVPIFSDVGVSYTPVLSGGSWLAALPLANLQDRRVAKVARSSDAAEGSTTFDMDLGVARAVRVCALVGNNFSTSARHRWRGWSSVPLVDWRPVGDGAWTNVGTPTRSAGATTVNGIPLDLIGDDDAGVQEQIYRALPSFTGATQKIVAFLVKRSSAYSPNQLILYDVGAAADRLRVNIDFTSATPVVTAPTGSIISTVAIDGGYRITALSTAVTPANAHRVHVVPAGNLAADTAAFYVGDIQVWDAASLPLVYDSGFVVTVLPAGLTPEQLDGYTQTAAHLTTSNQQAQYWRCTMLDTGNSAGYVQVGRLIIAGGFQPTINMSYGCKIGWEDASIRAVSDGGAAIYQVKSKWRVFTFALNDLPETEMLEGPFDIMAHGGTTRQLFFAFDPADTTHLHRRSALCVMRELNPLEMVSLARYGVPMSLVEEL